MPERAGSVQEVARLNLMFALPGFHRFDRGDEVTVQAGDSGIRFLLVSGKPIEEPVAWYGPIVMNTKAELQKAYEELQSGTFIKHSR